MSMLKSNLNYEDQYMYFNFKGRSSRDFNLIMQNDTDDLIINANRGTSVEFISPKYQKGQYLLGVTHSQREFPLTLVAEGLNKRDIREMLKWLETGNTGSLSFEYAPDWEYSVIVSDIENPNIYPMDEDGYFIVAFKITFVTVEQTIARNKLDGVADIHFFEGVNDGENWQLAEANNEKLIPPFAFKRSITNGENQLIMNINFLGNESAIIDCKSNFTTDGNNDTVYALTLTTDDVIKKQASAQLYFNENKAPVGTIFNLKYEGDSNLFLLNSRIAERFVIDGVLSGKENDTVTAYTQFKYTASPIVYDSPGEYIQVNDFTLEDLDQLLSTSYKFWVCYFDQEPNNTLSYYVPTETLDPVYAHLDYDMSTNTPDIVYGKYINNSTYNKFPIYIGFYRELTITTEGIQDITPIVTQYHYTL